MHDAKRLLESHFGHDAFLPGQREVVETLLGGESAAAVFPTGGGKSLCYQLPAVALEGLTLVVSPLIALMKDQIDALAARGIAARRMDSSLTDDEFRDVVTRLRAGDLSLLYVAPERFNNERFRGFVEELDIALFAVDEAHCISEWGHNFRPDYLKLPRFAERFGAQRVLALTATATHEVLQDICTGFGIPPENATRTEFYRPNLRLLATPVDADRRDDILVERLQKRPPGATIVYVTQQKPAESLAQLLFDRGFAARAYHAGMADDHRSATQEWFFGTPNAIVTATIAFGMGIDKADIRYVYHYNLPKSLESYAQEIGRAGRDGEPSICEVLAVADDMTTLENFAYGDTPSRSALDRFVDEVFDRDPSFDVGLHQLAAATDVRLLVLRTLLTYLELDGYLEGGTPLYAEYQFQPKASSQEILAGFASPKRELLAAIFRRSKKGRTWFKIDTSATAKELGVPRSRVISALEELHERQLLEVRAKSVRYRYRRLEEPEPRSELGDELARRVARREAREIERLQEVLAWLQRDGCQVRALGQRFGDASTEPCGHCSWCEGNGSTVELTPRSKPPASEGRSAQAVAAFREADVDVEARAVARFLCGLTSPWLTRAKLTRHELFGSLSEVSFGDVLTSVRSSVGSSG